MSADGKLEGFMLSSSDKKNIVEQNHKDILDKVLNRVEFEFLNLWYV